MKFFITIFPIIALLFNTCAAQNSKSLSNDDLVRSVETLNESGGRVSWSKDGEWIAIDQKDTDDYYDVYVMRPDKTDKKCLTCDKKSFTPQKHNGSPEFHPSGKYIVFTAEKQIHRSDSRYSRPGQGVYNDIWLMTVDGKKFWKIVDVPNLPSNGTVHPHFSDDGKKISWSVLYGHVNVLNPKLVIGAWKLKSADFSITPEGPKLTNIREHQPNVKAFYENHGFSKDGKKILFSSSYEARWHLDNNLYDVELSTGKVTNLSGKNYRDRSYDEHAQYTPDGKYIVWGTNRDNSNKGMDYWIMEADGTNQRRLTYFNHPTKNKHLPKGKTYTAVDLSFHPSGKKILAWIFTDWIEQIGFNAIIELNELDDPKEK